MCGTSSFPGCFLSGLGLDWTVVFSVPSSLFICLFICVFVLLRGDLYTYALDGRELFTRYIMYGCCECEIYNGEHFTCFLLYPLLDIPKLYRLMMCFVCSFFFSTFM